jgi:hypothetical protein
MSSSYILSEYSTIHKKIERVGSSGSTVSLHSGGAQFKSWLDTNYPG